MSDEALMTAKLAMQKIVDHERTCSERYGSILDHQSKSDASRAAMHTKIEAGFQSINNRLWAAAAVIIVTEFALIGFFYVH